MKTNILKAISNLVSFRRNDLLSIYGGPNRINSMGTALEYYLKDIFCNSLNQTSLVTKDKIHTQYMSYMGNQNNPPDFMISKGDAVESKKIEGLSSPIALNSSYPKSKMHADSSLITKACRYCEQWSIRDIIYAIGVVDTPNKKKLKLLWMVYGDCYAADRSVYERIKNGVSAGVNSIPGIDFAKTNELGRVNRVDPLGITNMRIRNLWHIENPIKVFNYIARVDTNNAFTLLALIRTSKYDTFPSDDRAALKNLSSKGLRILDVQIKDPDNPANLLPAKLVSFTIP